MRVEIFVVAALTLAAAALLTACSTTYKPEGYGGGYADTPLAQDTYQIDVRGNGYTSADKVRKIGLVLLSQKAAGE